MEHRPLKDPEKANCPCHSRKSSLAGPEVCGRKGAVRLENKGILVIGGGLLEPGDRACSTDEVMKTLMSQPDESDVLDSGNHQRRAAGSTQWIVPQVLICVLFCATSKTLLSEALSQVGRVSSGI
jgi:hypothetical protein